MKHLNKRNSSILFIMAVGVGTLISFQNFTRFESMKIQKTDDIYMGGALNDALKEAETENTANKVASNVDPQQIEERLKKKREKTVIQVEADLHVEDEESVQERLPASYE